MSGAVARLRAWRLRRVELRLADAEYDLDVARRFREKPSEIDWHERRVAQRARRVARLRPPSSERSGDGGE